LGRFGDFSYCTKVDAKLAEQVLLTHKFAKQCRVKIFRNDRTRSTPLDTKLMFVPFRTVSFCTKVNAKLAKLVPLSHKFAKQSRVGIFRSKRTLSTPLDQKLMFWGRFGPFRYCTKVDAKLAELVPLSHKFAKQSRVGIFRNERTRSTPFDPKLMF
jgi:hypothetical protein